MRISELTDAQKSQLAWRLDNKTACGLLAACSVARGERGDLDLVDVFHRYGDITERSAKIHARKVMNFGA
jgi:hypothetical protein